MSSSAFHLKVQQVEQICLFELSWGRGQHLAAKVPYPQTLTKLYQEWQRVYLSFYNTELRGRVIAAGSFAETPVNWHAKLVQAETHLLHEFHNWLRQGELYEIRAAIGKSGREEKRENEKSLLATEIFLTCEPLDLARFPWETWEIGKEFAIDCHIRIVRTPLNIREATTITPNYRRTKARVLAILGDDTGLNFQGDKEAVKSLSSVAEIEFVGWESGRNTDELKTKIVKAIASSPGWDILFFAGHSNETNLTGGEIAIAPNVTLSFNEIVRSLTIAKEKGLKFAIFNSCNGLSLANALIDLGLSQVAVMREPIHNQVAQAFLVRFLQHLGEFKDVGEALLKTSQYLKQELNLKYPSAYLIPSLFRYPDAPLFRLQPWGIKQELKRWIPSRNEAIALASLALLSWQLSIQGFLLERRVLIQAIYRQITHQIPPKTTPPMLLVQIDDQSIIEAKIKDPTPMDRRYLSKLIDKTSALNAKVIGVDYLLDRPHGENDLVLAKSINRNLQNQQSWFVFAATRNDAGRWVSVLPEIAGLNWSLQGDLNLFYSNERLMYMKLVPLKDNSSRNLPFAYLLALAYLANCEEKPNPPTPFPAREGGGIDYCNFLASTTFYTKEEGGVINRNLTPLSSQERGRGRGQIPQPQLRSPTDLLSQIIEHFAINQQDYRTLFDEKSRLHPITNFAYGLGKMWLHPIIDFSIPPDQVYQHIPAWKFLKLPNNSPQFQYINRQVITIAPGAYGDDPGVSIGKEDVFSLPLAVSYWRKKQKFSTSQRFLTGGEAHGYLFYTFLSRRLVVPIPDLWMIGLAAVLGKGLVQRQLLRQRRGIILLLIGMAVYGLISLQAYISAAIVLPFVFPIITVLIYILFMLRRKK